MGLDDRYDTDNGTIQAFDSGATRDTATGKLDPEGFTHPMVMKQFYKYMNMHRVQSDGKLRDSDNWQKGIPKTAYMKSLKRHCDEVWLNHRGYATDNCIEANLCGVLFNALGYLHEVLKAGDWKMIDFDGDDPIQEIKERLEKLEADNAK